MTIRTPSGHLENTSSNFFYMVLYLSLILVALPSLIYWILKHDDDTLKNKTFIGKWGVVYEEMKYYLPYGFKYRRYYLWFIARRTAYVMIMFVFPHHQAF